jgi:hypothetical protein
VDTSVDSGAGRFLGCALPMQGHHRRVSGFIHRRWRL